MDSRCADGCEHALATPGDLLVAAGLLITAIAGFFALFTLVWKRQPLEDLPMIGGWPAAIGIFIFGAALHELLHLLGWKLSAHVPWASLTIQRSRRKLGLIAQLRVPVRVNQYRVGVALPVAVLGLLVVAALVRGSGILLIWAAVLLFECFSDIAILIALRRVPPQCFVADHAGKLGCRLFPP